MIYKTSYKAEFDIYQILAFQAKNTAGQKRQIKPFKTLKGLIPDEWSSYPIKWLNSYQRVRLQCMMCWCIQTVGVTAILAYEFMQYLEGTIHRYTTYMSCL